MRYYVLAPTGERYGPADVALLNEWAAAGRVFPNSRLVEEMSGSVSDASTVPGMIFAQQTPFAPSPSPMQPLAPGAAYQSSLPPQPLQPGPAQYNRPGYSPIGGMTHDGGVKEMWMAFGAAFLAPIVGLLLVYGIVIAVGGVQFAWRAYHKGQKWAMLALILNVIAIPVAFYMRFILRYQLLSGRGY